MVEEGRFQGIEPTQTWIDNPGSPIEKYVINSSFSLNIHYFHKINGRFLKVTIPGEIFFLSAWVGKNDYV